MFAAQTLSWIGIGEINSVKDMIQTVAKQRRL
jgi:hypothetical protein